MTKQISGRVIKTQLDVLLKSMYKYIDKLFYIHIILNYIPEKFFIKKKLKIETLWGIFVRITHGQNFPVISITYSVLKVHFLQCLCDP